MPRAIRGLLAAAALAAGGAAAEPLPEPKVEFSADVHMEVSGPDGIVRMPGKMWHAKQRQRLEHDLQGHRAVAIIRKDRGVVWNLVPGHKLYVEHAVGSDGAGASSPGESWRDGEVELTKIGSETVAGRETTKYRVTASSPDGGEGGGLLWLDAQAIPVRIESDKGSGTERMHFVRELRNVQVGPQDASHFELPEGYRALSASPAPSRPGAPPPHP